MRNLKTALKTNNVEDYMSNISVADFIKDYESLDEKELKKFIDINTKLVAKDWISFDVQNLPEYTQNC